MPLIHSLWQRFKKNDSLVVHEREKSLHRANPLERYADLLAIQNQADFLRITHKESGYVYQSMILTINLYDQLLEIDDLFPAHPQVPIQPHDTLLVEHRRGFESLSLVSKVISKRQNPDGMSYVLKLPESVGYQPRRQHARLALSREKPITVKFLSPIKSTCYATADNISTGGMRLVVGGNIQDQLRQGGVLPLCEFKLIDNLSVRCRARIKGYNFYSRPYRRTELSVEFMDIAPDTQVQVKQFVDIIQRQLAA